MGTSGPYLPGPFKASKFAVVLRLWGSEFLEVCKPLAPFIAKLSASLALVFKPC